MKRKIKNNVQKYRIYKGILQKDLAKEIDISLSWLRRIEGQKGCPKPGTRIKLSDYFGVSHNQLFYCEE